MSSFLLSLCQPGAERALKQEALTAGLPSGFQRPGLVTFKSSGALDDDASFPSVFSRHTARSLGRCHRDALPTTLAALDVRCLHVASTASDDDDAFAAADALRSALVADRSLGLRAGEAPHGGERIATVVLVDDDIWMTVHRHRLGRSPFPGGRMRPRLPAEVPSRAWLKLEEARAVFDLSLREGDTALELGSAPGGATRALLGHGLSVVGVDPNAMDPGVLAHPRFSHRRTTSMSADPASLPPLHWILLDVNVPPRTALRGALPFVRHHAATLRGIVFTLKMGSWELAEEISSWLGRIRAAAPWLEVQARQLSSNGQEICVAGWRASSGVR